MDHLPNVAVDGSMTSKSVPLRGGHPYQIPESGNSKRGPGPKYFAYVLISLHNIITWRVYKLTLSEQAQVTVQLTVRLSDLV
jgi:hypothetical protein